MTEQLQCIALGIIRREAEVLLVERRRTEQDNEKESLRWVFPGGKIEANEAAFAAAEREVLEETGYVVRATELLDERQHAAFPVHVSYVACALAERSPSVVNDSGILQSKWVPIAKLGIYITSTLNEKVDAYLGRDTPPDHSYTPSNCSHKKV
jgi:mutator protein MutT